jgi:hypothetical protein
VPNIGVFDAEMRSQAWFDPTQVAGSGWFDYGMPFEHDLIGAEAVAAANPIFEFRVPAYA